MRINGRLRFFWAMPPIGGIAQKLLLVICVVVRQGSAALAAITGAATATGAAFATNPVPYTSCILCRLRCGSRRGNGRLLCPRALRRLNGWRCWASLVMEGIIVCVRCTANRAVASNITTATGTVVGANVMHNATGCRSRSRRIHGSSCAVCSSSGGVAVPLAGDGQDGHKGEN